MFDIDPWVLFFSIVFGFVAMGYISHGKKEAELNFLLAGIVLLVVTAVSNTLWVLLTAGAACIILPFYISF